jgi:tetratricopeptide (TPR) repeat protein
LGVFATPREAYPKAKEAAEKALQLDNFLAEAHTSLAWIHFVYDWDWDRAERELKRGIELNPSNATGHHWYGMFLINKARLAEAKHELERAEQLDPLSLIIVTQAGLPYYYGREYDEAIRHYQKALQLDENFWPAHYFLGKSLAEKGEFRQAISELQVAVRLSGGSTLAMAVLANVCALAGRGSDALSIADKLIASSTSHFVSSFEIAYIYSGLRNRTEAFKWLERARQERSLLDDHDISTEPALDDLRSDPRFQELMRRVGRAQ